MGSKEKLINKEILKMIFRKVGWIGALFQIMLLGIVAFPLFLQAIEFKNNPEFLGFEDSLFSVATQVQFMTFVFIPLILGIFMYSFLMNKKASVFTHSLPISRKSIYFHHTISGILMIVVPIIVTAILSMLINETSSIPADIKNNYVYLDWVLIACSVSFVMFSASTLVAMVTGNFIVQGALTFGMLFLPIVSYRGVVSIVTGLFPSSALELTIAVPSLHQAVNEYTLVAFVVSSIMFIVSYFTYLRRDIENASSPIVFKSLRPICMYLIILMGMFLASLIVVNFAASTVLYFVTLVCGAFFGYSVAVIIVKKGNNSPKDFKGFLVFLGLFTLLFVVLVKFSPTYESYVPEIEEITSVTIQDDRPQTDYDDELMQAFVELRTFTDEESFEIITEMHQDFIDELPEDYDPTYGYDQITFIYTLENGKQVSRTYNIYGDSGEIKQTLLNMPEFIENYCKYLDETVRENAEELLIYSSQVGPGYSISKEDEVTFNSFLDALIADVTEVGLVGAEYVGYEGTRFDVNYESVDGSGSSTLRAITITEEYVNTIQWLEENGYADLAEFIISTDY